ncbi:hypothetical protein [Myxosarcina sp. GI1]|uniref:hypothetical protein n=1 Tax=Myxosarcina sp. GI1 TaxID=1541065 RepID=UPI0012E06071|nr:hypothetical protein [Myxosarcina sp. GI1]
MSGTAEELICKVRLWLLINNWYKCEVAVETSTLNRGELLLLPILRDRYPL